MQDEVFGSIYGFSAGVEYGSAYIQKSPTSKKIFPEPSDLFYIKCHRMSSFYDLIPISVYMRTEDHLLYVDEVCIFTVDHKNHHLKISELEVLSKLEILLKKVAEFSGCTFEK